MVDVFTNGIPNVPSQWLDDMVLNLKAKNHAEFQREREKLLDAYEGNNAEDLTKDYFKNKEKAVQSSVPNASQNLIDRAIRRRSLVYKNEPDYGKDIKWPDGYLPDKRWRFFKGAERAANNIGTVLLRPKTVDEQMRYEWIWNYLPFFDEDPLEPTGIMYSVVAPSADISKSPEIEWLWWSKDTLLLLDSNGKIKPQSDNPENINKYGILPFVTVNVRMGREYWQWGYGKPLLDANTAINVALTEMRLGIRFTMMGQWVVTGPLDDTKITKGVDQVIKLPAGSTMEAIAPPAKMAEAVQYIRTEYDNVFQNMGMKIKWADAGDAPSGISLKIEGIELLELRQDDVAIWKNADAELYEIEQVVWKVDFNGELPERTINFTEVEFPVTPEQQQSADQWDLDHGQITEAQILRRNDPDGYKDEAAAQVQVDKNKATTAPARVASGASAFSRGA